MLASHVLLAAVKKTLNSTGAQLERVRRGRAGGIVWKTHRFATPSKTARANAKARQRLR